MHFVNIVYLLGNGNSICYTAVWKKLNLLFVKLLTMPIHRNRIHHNGYFDENTHKWTYCFEDGPYVLPNSTKSENVFRKGELALYYIDDDGKIFAVINRVPIHIFAEVSYNMLEITPMLLLDGIVEYESLADAVLILGNTLYDVYGDVIVDGLTSNTCVMSNICRNYDLMIIQHNVSSPIERFIDYDIRNIIVVDIINKRICMRVFNIRIISGYNFEDINSHPDELVSWLSYIMRRISTKHIKGNIDCDVISNRTFRILSIIVTIDDDGNIGDDKCGMCKRTCKSYSFGMYDNNSYCQDCYGPVGKKPNVVLVC